MTAQNINSISKTKGKEGGGRVTKARYSKDNFCASGSTTKLLTMVRRSLVQVVELTRTPKYLPQLEWPKNYL